MKKVFVTILSLVYLTASVGATVQLHYCMDKLVEWRLGGEKSKVKSCPYCGMAKTTDGKHCGNQNDGCCKDEQKQVKIEKDQKVAGESFNFEKPFFPTVIHTSFEYSFIEITSPVLAYPTTHAPPKRENVALFVRNCIFRI